MRHAHSEWNADNRFSGWADIPLSRQGEQEAQAAGHLLRERGFVFDRAFTSMQKRAYQTLDTVLKILGQESIPVERSWRLNERHYGAFQGLDKAEVGRRFGAEALQRIRRGYHERPPPLDAADPRHPCHDPLYASLDPSLLPASESLEDTEHRLVPYWQSHLRPALARHERILVVSHGNTLRALVRILEDLSETEVEHLEIPTGRPLLFRFDSTGQAAESVLL